MLRKSTSTLDNIRFSMCALLVIVLISSSLCNLFDIQQLATATSTAGRVALDNLNIMTAKTVPNTAALKKTNVTTGYTGVTPTSQPSTFGFYFGSPNATTAPHANATTAPHVYYCEYANCMTNVTTAAPGVVKNCYETVTHLCT